MQRKNAFEKQVHSFHCLGILTSVFGRFQVRSYFSWVGNQKHKTISVSIDASSNYGIQLPKCVKFIDNFGFCNRCRTSKKGMVCFNLNGMYNLPKQQAFILFQFVHATFWISSNRRKLGVWQFGFFVVGQNRITPTNWIETKRLTCWLHTTKRAQQWNFYNKWVVYFCIRLLCWNIICDEFLRVFVLLLLLLLISCVWLLLLLMLLLLLLLLFVFRWCYEQFHFSCCLLMGKGTQQTKLSRIQLSRYCWFGLVRFDLAARLAWRGCRSVPFRFVSQTTAAHKWMLAFQWDYHYMVATGENPPAGKHINIFYRKCGNTENAKEIMCLTFRRHIE